jgi:hypothetical protein
MAVRRGGGDADVEGGTLWHQPPPHRNDEVEVDVMSLLDHDLLLPPSDPLLPEPALLEAPLPMTVHLTVMVGRVGTFHFTLF